MNIKPIDYRGYDLFHQGILTFADIESNGICVDIDYCKMQEKHINKRIEHIDEQLNDSELMQLWKKKKGRDFNVQSDEQMAYILFDVMGHKSKIFTETGKKSTSEDALERIDCEDTKLIIQRRRLKKARDTYLGNIIRETVDGVLHSFYHLHIARTFRGSCSRINFQNMPKRQPEIKGLIRKAIIPRKDHLLVELDYSGVEIRVGACYHKDPEMFREINDPAKDMHRDMILEIFMLQKHEVTKALRHVGKNGFVFPEFYGDYFKSIAQSIWDTIEIDQLKTADGIFIKDHLRNKGIRHFSLFEEHLEKIETNFWKKRFPVYADWKEKHYNAYIKRGHFDTLTGFTCSGYMSKNDAVNYPVQGSAFHCLLWSLIHLNKFLKDNKWSTQIVGQIHDSIVADVHPDELNEFIDVAKDITTNQIRKAWDWIVVPLDVDVECSPPNESWHEMKEVDKETCAVCDCNWIYENECLFCGERNV